MDGLAATLAAIACGFFAIDAATVHPTRPRARLALARRSRAPASCRSTCAAASPRPSSWATPAARRSASRSPRSGSPRAGKVAGTTVATLVLPILILAVPILDTALVDRRCACSRDGRSRRAGATTPRTGSSTAGSRRGTRCCCSRDRHRRSARRASPTTCSTTARITVVGVLHLRAAAPVRELPRRRRATAGRRRRVEHASPCTGGGSSRCSSTARSSRRPSSPPTSIARRRATGTINQRHLFAVTLPVLLAARFLTFIPFGLYRSVWRYAGARDAAVVLAAVVVSELVASPSSPRRSDFGDFPRSIFVDRRAALRAARRRLALRRARVRRVVLRASPARSAPAPRADRRRGPQRPQPAARAARDAGRARRRLRRRRPAPARPADPRRPRARRLDELAPARSSAPRRTPCSSRSPTRRRERLDASSPPASERTCRAASCGASSPSRRRRSPRHRCDERGDGGRPAARRPDRSRSSTGCWRRCRCSLPLPRARRSSTAGRRRAHGTPWIFTDELEFTQLARSVAETGELARRGEPLTGQFSLYPYLTAPAWFFDDTESGYEAAKLIAVLAMTLALFPAYGLARLVVSRPAALLAALGATMIPALAYASMLVEEPFAYPWATLCLYLIARAGTSRRPAWTFAAAVAAAAVAPLFRDELVVVPRSSSASRSWSGWQRPARAGRPAALASARLRAGAVALVVGRLSSAQRGRRALGRVADRVDAVLPGAPARVRRLGRRRVHDRDRRPAGRRRARLPRAGPGEPAHRGVDALRARARPARSSAFCATRPLKAAYLSTVFADRVGGAEPDLPRPRRLRRQRPLRSSGA